MEVKQTKERIFSPLLAYGKIMQKEDVMKKRIRSIGLLFVLGLCVGFFGVLAIYQHLEDRAAREGFYSEAVVVYDRESSKTVFSFGAHKKLAPASLVKLMTCDLVLDRQADLGAPAPILPESKALAFDREAAQSALGPDNPTNYRDLLYATMLASDGAAAQSLAIHVAGDEERFVRMMNRKAFRMGLFRTHFSDCIGFDDAKQKSSARDMARLMDKALRDPDFYELFTSPSYYTDGIQIWSTVIGPAQAAAPADLQILGGKSGSTHAAGRCWATLAEKDGREYICVVLGAPFDSKHQIDDTMRAYAKIGSSLQGLKI